MNEFFLLDRLEIVNPVVEYWYYTIPIIRYLSSITEGAEEREDRIQVAIRSVKVYVFHMILRMKSIDRETAIGDIR